MSQNVSKCPTGECCFASAKAQKPPFPASIGGISLQRPIQKAVAMGMRRTDPSPAYRRQRAHLHKQWYRSIATTYSRGPRMATPIRWTIIGIVLSIIFTAGCQPKKTTVARTLPPPSFDGPRVAPRAGLPNNALAHAPSGERAWKPTTTARAWKWIVIHHSATPTGSMAMFDKEHKSKGWDGV